MSINKNIIITPNTNRSGFPNIQFVGSSSAPISLNVLDDNTISFSGAQGQLLSINNNLTSGTIFSVGDVSGIPSIEVNSSGTIILGQFGTNVGIGTPNPNFKLSVTGTLGVSGSTTLSTISGTTAQFTTLSASNVLIFGTASLFTNPQSAYIVYSSSSNKLVAFPGLIVTGSITGSESISAVTISGTTAQFITITGSVITGSVGRFTTITASNIYPLSFGGNYPLLLGGPEVGMPGWQVIGTGTGGVACPLSSSYIVPFWFGAPITVITASFYVTATVVGARADFSIWRCEFTSSSPAFVPVSRSYVQSNIDVSTVQLYNITSSMPLTLDPGFYAAVITSNTSSLTCRALTYSADSFRSARLSATDFQLQLLEAYTAPTGYPIGTNWSGSISISTANGALGYRGQVAIRWAQ